MIKTIAAAMLTLFFWAFNVLIQKYSEVNTIECIILFWAIRVNLKKQNQ